MFTATVLPPARRNLTKDRVLSAPLPPGRARPGVEALVEELADQGSDRGSDREAELVISGEDSAIVERDTAGSWMSISCPEDLSPILYALPAQILAHDLALPRGLDPDAPRGLSKATEIW